MDNTYETVCTKFGQQLRITRKKQLYTQKSFGDSTSVSWRFLQELERGNKQPSMLTLFDIAYTLNVSPCDLMEDAWQTYQEIKENQ